MPSYGFTNDQQGYERVVAFRKTAVLDGWDIQPTYKDAEPTERASSLTKEGFGMQIITRTNVGKWRFEACINIWGPDKLQINVPDEYDWKAIKAGLRICNECNAQNVDTFRFSFAGRCCKQCLPAMQKKHEYPGWSN